MLTNGSRSHTLEVRNVTFTCTLEQESACSRLYSPPDVVHLLNDVSLEAVSGEVHAIVGASGSGKNVLLEAIACTAVGDTAGTIQLDKYIMTQEALIHINTIIEFRFRKLCSYIPCGRQYPGFMTLRSLLHYTATLNFGGTVPANEVERRLHRLMRAFDLLGYGHEKLQNLSKSARRRAVVAVALVKDPLLLIVEDPFRELEPIACYQLMYCLRNYAAEQSRIVLTTISKPRSDICQIISRITVLFHGEVMYSGYIRNLLSFIRDAGLRCTKNEDPVMYYLTKATLNRETQETYEETYNQALRLIDFFKTHSPPAVPARFGHGEANTGGTVALCYLPSPSSTKTFFMLVQRSFVYLCSNKSSLLLRVSALPIIMLFLSLFSMDLFSGSWTAPHSASRILEAALFIVYLTGTCLTLHCYSDMRSLSFIESFDGLYNNGLSSLAFICAVAGADFMSSTLSAAILLWISIITSLETILRTSPVFACVFFIAQIITMTAMLYIRDSLACCAFSLSFLLLWMLFGGGLLRSLATLPFYPLTYLSYINPIRFANYILVSEITTTLPVHGCARTEKGEIDTTPLELFCRWPNGSSYFLETFPDSVQPRDYWTNMAALVAIVLALFVLMLFLHAIPHSRQSIEKIRMSN